MLKYEMMEKENNTEGTIIFDDIIQQIIIKMNIKRGHKEDLDSKNIRNKLISIDSNKKGEYWEFLEEYEISNGKLTPNLALEMADIAYYTSQQNCPEDLKPMATDLENKIGISHKLAQQFCILKYDFRSKEPIYSKDYKQKEYNLMNDFLNKNLNFLSQ